MSDEPMQGTDFEDLAMAMPYQVKNRIEIMILG